MEKVIHTSNEMTGMFGLPDKNFKASMVKILQGAIRNMLEVNKKIKCLSKK